MCIALWKAPSLSIFRLFCVLIYSTNIIRRFYVPEQLTQVPAHKHTHIYWQWRVILWCEGKTAFHHYNFFGNIKNKIEFPDILVYILELRRISTTKWRYFYRRQGRLVCSCLFKWGLVCLRVVISPFLNERCYWIRYFPFATSYRKNWLSFFFDIHSNSL